jgi:hypothetical protein
MIMELSLLDAQAQCPGPDGNLVMCGLWCNWRKSLFNEKKHRHLMLHISMDTGHVITGLSLLDAEPQYLGPDGYLAMCRLWCNWRKSLFNEKNIGT